jgi:hypothetical protein
MYTRGVNRATNLVLGALRERAIKYTCLSVVDNNSCTGEQNAGCSMCQRQGAHRPRKKKPLIKVFAAIREVVMLLPVEKSLLLLEKLSLRIEKELSL